MSHSAQADYDKARKTAMGVRKALVELEQLETYANLLGLPTLQHGSLSRMIMITKEHLGYEPPTEKPRKLNAALPEGISVPDNYIITCIDTNADAGRLTIHAVKQREPAPDLNKFVDTNIKPSPQKFDTKKRPPLYPAGTKVFRRSAKCVVTLVKTKTDGPHDYSVNLTINGMRISVCAIKENELTPRGKKAKRYVEKMKSEYPNA